MRVVRDETGKRYLLVSESSDASRVRDPATGAEQYIENERLTAASGAARYETLAEGVPEPVRALVTAVHDDHAIGLLLELDDRGPLAVRTLLDRSDRCESDLHGLLTELRAAGLIEPASVAGERGYETTATAATALAHLRRSEHRTEPPDGAANDSGGAGTDDTGVADGHENGTSAGDVDERE
jgi:hypothetical protein